MKVLVINDGRTTSFWVGRNLNETFDNTDKKLIETTAAAYKADGYTVELKRA